MTDGHGDDIYRYGDKVKYNFSSNIYAHAELDNLQRYLSDRLGSIRNYPEPVPVSVEKMLSDTLGIRESEVMVTSGATELIYMIARLYSGAKSAILSPTFSEYADACRASFHDLRFIHSLDEVSDEQLVWLCNPNNPTGSVIDRNLLTAFIESRCDKIFIVDQAYEDYTSSALLPDVSLPNVIVIHSMTKRYCVPGLRVGYATGDEKLLSPLRELRHPWSVSGIAIEGARYLLSHDTVIIPLQMLLNEAKRVADALSKTGIKITPSCTNFMLCELPRGTAAQLKSYLIDNHGILIRDASNFHFLSPAHFRIAVQNPDENDLLIKAIEQWSNI